MAGYIGTTCHIRVKKLRKPPKWKHRWTLFCYNWSENRKMGVFSSVMTDSYD